MTDVERTVVRRLSAPVPRQELLARDGGERGVHRVVHVFDSSTRRVENRAGTALLVHTGRMIKLELLLGVVAFALCVYCLVDVIGSPERPGPQPAQARLAAAGPAVPVGGLDRLAGGRTPRGEGTPLVARARAVGLSPSTTGRDGPRPSTRSGTRSSCAGSASAPRSSAAATSSPVVPIPSSIPSSLRSPKGRHRPVSPTSPRTRPPPPTRPSSDSAPNQPVAHLASPTREVRDRVCGPAGCRLGIRADQAFSKGNSATGSVVGTVDPAEGSTVIPAATALATSPSSTTVASSASIRPAGTMPLPLSCSHIS